MVNSRIKIIKLLSSGGSYSVIDIVKRIDCVADPRSEIRHLRNAGVAIQDSWETSPSGSRYKKYWLAPEIEGSNNIVINGKTD